MPVESFPQFHLKSTRFSPAEFPEILPEAIRHFETSYIFPAPEKCHLARVSTAGSELTHPPHFHMVNTSTQACSRAILSA
jgi:hypothetical protein